MQPECTIAVGYDYAPLPRIADDMGSFIQTWITKFGKPVIVSEYGAGAIPGMHHEPPIQYSEELQVAIHAEVHRAFDRFLLNGLVGEHVHSFHDFKQVLPTRSVPLCITV